MAALSANAVTPPLHSPGTAIFRGTYKATGADEYYDGAVVCEVAGKAILTNADGVTTLGIFRGRTTAAAADDPIRVHVKGVWWIASAGCTDAALGGLMAPTAVSDNPADVIAQSSATPFALGVLIHVDATAVSGWVDLDADKGLANA